MVNDHQPNPTAMPQLPSSEAADSGPKVKASTDRINQAPENDVVQVNRSITKEPEAIDACDQLTEQTGL